MWKTLYPCAKQSLIHTHSSYKKRQLSDQKTAVTHTQSSFIHESPIIHTMKNTAPKIQKNSLCKKSEILLFQEIRDLQGLWIENKAKSSLIRCS
jgi:hypothetical protein